jgi:hypothetical protein
MRGDMENVRQCKELLLVNSLAPPKRCSLLTARAPALRGRRFCIGLLHFWRGSRATSQI